MWYGWFGIHITAVKRCRRRVVAIDETKLLILGRQVFLRAAIGVCSREVYVDLSFGRTNWDVTAFVRTVTGLCAGPLIPHG